MNRFKLIALFLAIIFLGGCAEIPIPTPKDIIKQPIGTDSVKVGMTKDKIRELWGKPDQINFVRNKERWGGEREEWVYRAAYSGIPVDAGYLSRTKRLYFDGPNLTNIAEE